MSLTPERSRSSAMARSTAALRLSCRRRRYHSRMARRSGSSRKRRSGSCIRVLATRPTMIASPAPWRRMNRVQLEGRSIETSRKASQRSGRAGSYCPRNPTQQTRRPALRIPSATSTGRRPCPAMSPIGAPSVMVRRIPLSGRVLRGPEPECPVSPDGTSVSSVPIPHPRSPRDGPIHAEHHRLLRFLHRPGSRVP